MTRDNELSAYKKGIETGWGNAKRILCMKKEELNKVFNCQTLQDVIRLYNALDIEKALENYDYEKHKQVDSGFDVGYELEDSYGYHKVVVVKKNGGKFYDCIYPNGMVRTIDATKYKWTGKIFPQISEMLEALKTKEEG